jgi:hypothetical protein
MLASEESVRIAGDHLSSHDPVLAAVITSYGPCTIRPFRTITVNE